MSHAIDRLQPVIQDFRAALRTFRGSPSFTATAILVLTLGIGANIAIFSVVNGVLLKPVPFPDADRLVMLMISQDDNPVFAGSSRAQFVHFKAQTDVLADVAAFRNSSSSYADGETPVHVRVGNVSEAYFRALRAPFLHGRAFTAEEDSPGAGPAVVLSHAFWTQYLGADPNAVGSKLSLSGESRTVVGVVGTDFDVRELGDPQVWVPLQVAPTTTDRGYLLQVVARLKAEVTLAQAQARLEASVAGYLEAFPNEFSVRGGFSALPLQEAMVGRDARTTLFILIGAVTFVLLIACANVANLLLVRATGRRREFAVRAALGAGRARIVQQLLAEGILLSLAGSMLGAVAGFFGMRALLAIDSGGLPRLGDAGSLVGVDWRVAAFTVVVSLITALAFSLAPVFAGSRMNLVEGINASGLRSGGGLRQSNTRSLLVIVEVASAVLLLIGAALLVRTSVALNRVDPGFDTANLVTMRTALNGTSFAETANVAQLVQSTREALRAVPGVVDAAAASSVPGQAGWGLPFNIPGRDNQGLYTGGAAVVFTSPEYFDVLDIAVVRGRAFDGSDRSGAPPVVIINEALAREYWPDAAEPLGDRMLVGGGAVNMQAYAEEPLREIVGIVANVRSASLAEEPGPVMYVSHSQLPDTFNELLLSDQALTWIVRTQGDPSRLAPDIQEAVQRATGLPATDRRTMDEVLSLSVSRQRLQMWLVSVFGCCALLLATIGLYGVMASVVQRRTHEIGVRMALGADPASVRGMVIRHGMLLVGAGLVAGLVAAYYLAAVLSATLFGVEAHDVAVFVTIPVLLAIVAFAAVAIPAARASRVDPLAAVQYE
jgi:putative ABC transport system permease protein